MAVRVATSSFVFDVDCGDDEHGKAMNKLYRDRLTEVFKIMAGQAVIPKKPEGPKKRLRKCPACASKTEARHFEWAHSCPYHNDINNDPAFRCNCCADCENRCFDDI